MQRVSLEWYVQLGLALKPLRAIGNFQELEIERLMELWTAQQHLNVLADSTQSHLQLRASRPLINRLLDQIQAVTAPQDGPTAAHQFGLWKFSIAYSAQQLEPLLNGELGVQNCYLVWPKRAYDIEMLAEDGVKLFSDDVQRGLIDIERYDIQQAGRCLAFEVPTAALFHMFRAADSVLRRWYKQITGDEPKAKARNWGAYIRNLRNCHADPKILTALEQIKDLHRNPVIHPEAQISIEEALSFVGIAESIISSMIVDISRRTSMAVSTLLSAAAS